MKLPEKPIDWKETLKRDGDKVFRLIKDEDLFRKVIDFNRRHLFWDEIKYRSSNKTEQDIYGH